MTWIRVARALSMLSFLVSVVASPCFSIEWVVVGEPGNPPDDEVACESGSSFICRANLGAVAYRYAISKHEITNQEYVEFLNAVAASDPNGLFNPNMQAVIGEITRTGSEGSYTYAVTPGFEQYPVRYVDHFRTFRFANWLHNGKPTGSQDATTTEDGTYTLLGANPVDVQRNPGALYWLPSEDEWYKAAFYDPAIGWYWDYPIGSDLPPVGEPPPGGVNSANLCPRPVTEGGPASCEPGVSMGPDEPTEVGAYLNSPSPWGTFDQAGNLWEFLEDRVDDERTPIPQAAVRGSGFTRGVDDAAAFSRSDSPMECGGCSGIGFRMGAVESVPEPSALVLQAAVATTLAWIGRRGTKGRAGAKRGAPDPRACT